LPNERKPKSELIQTIFFKSIFYFQLLGVHDFSLKKRFRA
jgi:hypothetical protein